MKQSEDEIKVGAAQMVVSRQDRTIALLPVYLDSLAPSSLLFLLFFYFLFFCFLGPYLQHTEMEIPRLGVESDL